MDLVKNIASFFVRAGGGGVLQRKPYSFQY